MSVIRESLKRIAADSAIIYQNWPAVSVSTHRMLRRMKQFAQEGRGAYSITTSRIPKKALKELAELGFVPTIKTKNYTLNPDVHFYLITFSFKD
jgi:hypothetical protein